MILISVLDYQQMIFVTNLGVNDMIGIFLDDERNPEDVTWINYPTGIEWVVVRTLNELISSIQSTNEEHCISFDHDICDYDISGRENTGYDCLKYVINHCLDINKKIPMCYFHTKNIIGLRNMMMFYENSLKYI